MTLSKKIRWLRDRRTAELGRIYSQEMLASDIGTHQTEVSRWEQGRGKPDPGDLLSLHRHFGVPLSWLLDDAQEAPPPIGLDDKERQMLDIVRRLGIDTAIDRLIGTGTSLAGEPPAEADAPKVVPGTVDGGRKSRRKA